MDNNNSYKPNMKHVFAPDPSDRDIGIALVFVFVFVATGSLIAVDISFFWMLLLFTMPLAWLALVGWVRGAKEAAQAVYQDGSMFQRQFLRKLMRFVLWNVFACWVLILGHDQSAIAWLGALLALLLGWKLRPWLQRVVKRHVREGFRRSITDRWQGWIAAALAGLIVGLAGMWSYDAPSWDAIWQVVKESDAGTAPQRIILAFNRMTEKGFYGLLDFLVDRDTGLWHGIRFLHLFLVWGFKILVLHYAAMGVARIRARGSLAPLWEDDMSKIFLLGMLLIGLLWIGIVWTLG